MRVVRNEHMTMCMCPKGTHLPVICGAPTVCRRGFSEHFDALRVPGQMRERVFN
jgi:hypothetical protein